MVFTTRRSERTIEQVVANAKAGILNDDLDASAPPELFGPPTEAEKRAAAAKQANGADAKRGHRSGETSEVKGR